MAGLRVGQACEVLLLPGFGVSSSSPQVPRHPTSICDAGVKSSFAGLISRILITKVFNVQLRIKYFQGCLLSLSLKNV